MVIKHVLIVCGFMMMALLEQPLYADDNLGLDRIVNSEHRAPDNRARDSYRHPKETLAFFGLHPSMTVVEIWPAKGWYTEILAPWLKQGHGQLIAAGFPANEGPEWRQIMQQNYQHWLAASPEYYGAVELAHIGPPTHWTIAADNSADAVVSFRNVHNWVAGGYAHELFAAMFRVLKSGGILGLTDHRARPDTDLETMKKSGYLTQALVIDLAQHAGFVFEAASEINANPRDTKDHPKGVWTLPPSLRLGEQNKQHYLAIGESDRMTLRFKKP